MPLRIRQKRPWWHHPVPRVRPYVNETLHLAHGVFQMTHMSNYFLTSAFVYFYLWDASLSWAESWILWVGIFIFIQRELIVTFYSSEYFFRKVYFKKLISHIQKCEEYTIVQKFGVTFFLWKNFLMLTKVALVEQ